MLVVICWVEQVITRKDELKQSLMWLRAYGDENKTVRESGPLGIGKASIANMRRPKA